MHRSLDVPRHNPTGWIYASLTVIDGQRHLKPTHSASDYLRFAQPPHLESGQVEIILTNSDAEQRHTAIVLPHETDATQIPIRLLPQP